MNLLPTHSEMLQISGRSLRGLKNYQEHSAMKVDINFPILLYNAGQAATIQRPCSGLVSGSRGIRGKPVVSPPPPPPR